MTIKPDTFKMTDIDIQWQYGTVEVDGIRVPARRIGTLLVAVVGGREVFTNA